MARPQRTRASRVPLTIEKLVKVGDQLQSFDGWGSRLEKECESVLGRAYAATARKRPLNPHYLANALLCGRFIASSSLYGPYEPTKYCKIKRLCRRCYHCLEKNRATQVATSAFNATNGKFKCKLFHFVFTMPPPKTSAEEIDYARSAIGAMEQIIVAKKRWNNSKKKPPAERLHDCTMGVHFKPVVGSDLLWSHIHLVIVAGHDVNLTGQFGQGLQPYLKAAFDHAVDLPAPSVTKAQHCGRLSESVPKRAQRKPGFKPPKLVTTKQLENTFAYALRNDENDDTVDTIAARDRLLEKLGNPCTFKRSRRSPDTDGKSKNRVQGPSEFHPVRLGKPYIYFFPFDAESPIAITQDDYDSQAKSALDTAIEIANRYVTPSADKQNNQLLETST